MTDCEVFQIGFTAYNSFQGNEVIVNFPCDENRGKIDDLIAIYGPINCALYRDKIDQFDEF
jgi:hypothetical protein